MRARIVIAAPRLATGVGRLTRSRARPVVIPITATAHRALADQLARHLVPIDGVEVPIAEPSAPPDTGARLATALLAYMALVTAVVTLLPFQFAFPTQPRIVLAGGLVDMLANVVLFVPLGFLYAVARKESNPSLLRVFVVALLASAAIESVQLFEATRYASLSDILANGLGAALGAVGQRGLARRIAMDAQDRWPAIARAAAHGTRLSARAATLARRARRPRCRRRTSGHSSRSDCSARACWRRRNDITSVPTVSLSRGLMTGAACAWFLLGGFPGTRAARLDRAVPDARGGRRVRVGAVGGSEPRTVDQPTLRVEGAVGSRAVLRGVSAAPGGPGGGVVQHGLER